MAKRETEAARPDLQELVAKFGGYNLITPEAWAEFDADMNEWKAKVRRGEFYP